MVFLSPQPAAGLQQSLYSGDYQSYTPASARKAGMIRWLKALCLAPYRFRYGNESGLFRPFGSQQLLDIGCGIGDYLIAMAELGWRVSGIDLSEQAVSVARRRLPTATIVCGAIEDFRPEQNSFDAVTLWHTLEHLANPMAVLQRIREAIRPGGRVVVAVPNFGSLEARILGRRWVEIDVPGHLFFFTRETLCNILKDAGFIVVRARPQVHPSTVAESLGFLVDDIQRLPVARRRPSLYYGSYPSTALSYALGNWGCIEVTAVPCQ